MRIKSTSLAVACGVLASLGAFASSALAKEPPVKTSTPFTAEYGGGEYFGPENTLHCKGLHKTNSVAYPGSGNKGGKDIETCKLSKNETFPARWQTPGAPIDIDDNFWGSDFDGQEVPFMEELPKYGVVFSKVNSQDNAFKVKVVFPNM
jgi:hypothetical protein